MRHSPHSRFVTSPNIDNSHDENSSPPLPYHHTTAPRSFQHPYPATLATRRSYADPTYSHQTHEFYYAQLFSQHQHPEHCQPHGLDVSHLSNRYTEIVRRQQEANHQDSSPRVNQQQAYSNAKDASPPSGISTSRPGPLGLGITFDPPLTVGLAGDEATSSGSISSPASASAPLSMQTSEVQYLGNGTCPSVSNDLCLNRDSTSTAFNEHPFTVQDVQALMRLNEYAYSSSPSSDFVAHSPSVGLDISAPLPADADMEDLKNLADFPVDIDENDTLVLEDIVMDSPGYATIKDKDISMSSPPEHEQDPMIGLFPDINLRTLVTQFREPSVGIDPSCIMGSSPILVDSPNGDNDSIRDYVVKEEDDFEMGSDESTVVLQKAPTMTSKSRSPSPTCVTANVTLEKETIIDVDEFPDEAVSAIFQVLAASIKKEAAPPEIPAIPPPVIAQSRYETINPTQLQLALPLSAPASAIPAAASAPVVTSLSQQTPFQIPGSSSQAILPPRLPLRSFGKNYPVVVYNGKGEKKKEHHKAKDYRVPLADITQQFQNRTTVFHADPRPASPTPHTNHAHAHIPTQTRSTVEKSPVLNAHLGVPLEELRRKAYEFRERNPGQDIDKGWLQDFAGRLSERGELLGDYRCYVVGCSQRNKRRDHILVHVGSHVEYRPFECERCGMRFLRKNECKRHVSSHGGEKPFKCPICAPTQDKSFVRQDLLKRHMKVTHGVLDRKRRAQILEEYAQGVANGEFENRQPIV